MLKFIKYKVYYYIYIIMSLGNNSRSILYEKFNPFKLNL